MNKLLQIQDLDKSFAGVHAINHLSFDVYEGEILALIGPNGCGKSTCVNLISGVYIQDSGKIVFDNEHELYRQKIQERPHLPIPKALHQPDGAGQCSDHSAVVQQNVEEGRGEDR